MASNETETASESMGDTRAWVRFFRRKASARQCRRAITLAWDV